MFSFNYTENNRNIIYIFKYNGLKVVLKHKQNRLEFRIYDSSSMV